VGSTVIDVRVSCVLLLLTDWCYQWPGKKKLNCEDWKKLEFACIPSPLTLCCIPWEILVINSSTEKVILFHTIMPHFINSIQNQVILHQRPNLFLESFCFLRNLTMLPLSSTAFDSTAEVERIQTARQIQAQLWQNFWRILWVTDLLQTAHPNQVFQNVPRRFLHRAHYIHSRKSCTVCDLPSPTKKGQNLNFTCITLSYLQWEQCHPAFQSRVFSVLLYSLATI